MDTWQYIFPFIMAVITNSIMIVIIYFLRKTPYFANLFGVGFMVILYLLGVLRMFLPIEFPEVQIIIRDSVVLNTLIESMIQRESVAFGSPSVLFYVILGVWAAGAVLIGAVTAYTQRSYRLYIMANTDVATDAERAMLSRTATELLGSDKNITLRKSDAVARIAVIGFVHKCILLPAGDYPPAALDMILRHECTHIRNKDLWLKLLIQIYCCIFWWNPFSYLLKHDLDYSLEMKCDLGVVRRFTPEETLLYLQTIHSSASSQRTEKSRRKSPFLVCAELSDARKNKELVKRIRAITAAPPKKAGMITVNVLVSAVMVAVFVLSYVFILQPFFGLPDEETVYGEVDIVADDSNCYLVKQADGSYLFYFLDYPPEVIPAEEFDEEMFKGYPILEN